jgi:hypothetical protein
VTKKRRKLRRLLPKFLLVLAYAAVLIFIGTILLMKSELRRVGFFGSESATVHPGAQSLPASPSPGTALQQDSKSSPRSVEDLTRDDKKQLDDILRARKGKP